MSLPHGTLSALGAFCLLCLSTPASAQIWDALADSDLSVAGISYGMDSSGVRRILGPPTSRDTASASWHYDGLVIYFGGRTQVHQIAIVGGRYATRRGLRVGDPVSRITELYGRPCQHRAVFYGYCRTVGDMRGIAIEVEGGKVTVIRVGAVIDLLGQ